MPRVSDEYRAARRSQIIDAAVQCFARQGFHRTTMQDIFTEVGLSAGSVYTYFESKAEIVQAIADDRHDREGELLAAAVSSDDLDAGLHGLVHDYFSWLRDPGEQQRRRVAVQLWTESLFDPTIAGTVTRGDTLRPVIVALVVDGQRTGSVDPALDPEAIARLVQSVVQGFILQLAWEPDLDVDAYVAVVDALIDGWALTRDAGSPKTE